MENIIKFETGDRPLFLKGDFPYDDLLKSLDALKGTTKAVIGSASEITQARIQTTRNILKRRDKDSRLRSTKKNGKVYLWLE